MQGDKKFLCFNLETSATVYGWIALCLSVMGMIFATVTLNTNQLDDDCTLKFIEENFYVTKEGFCYMILVSCFITLATSAFIIIAVAKVSRKQNGRATQHHFVHHFLMKLFVFRETVTFYFHGWY